MSDEMLQAITDPENQPSQYGTVTLDYHFEKIKKWEDLFERMSNKVLQQPEQEPVAMVESVATVVSESGNKEVTMSWWHKPALPVGTKLYTHPSQNVIDKSAAKRIATTLGWEPKRGWVDVPDEEIKILWIQYRAAMPRYLCFAKALLARSKEKNNA
jgi:hypothetical protein